MKKVALAFCLFVAAETSFAQPPVTQQKGTSDLCDCIGIGIPNTGSGQISPVPAGTYQKPIVVSKHQDANKKGNLADALQVFWIKVWGTLRHQ